jgi:DNA-binding transcriptional LysR family regulator
LALTNADQVLLERTRRILEELVDTRAELDLTERIADPVTEQVDAVIRMGDLPDSTLIATKIAPQARLLVASPRFLDRFGHPESTSALMTHRLLDQMHGADLLGWSALLGRPVRDFASGQDVFRCDDFEVLRGGALRGIDIAFLPSWVVGEDVSTGALVPLLPESVRAAGDVGAIHVLRALADPPAKIRAFITALRDHIGTPAMWDRGNPAA